MLFHPLQDLQQLQSIFTAKPWRQGCRGILAFIFRTRAAALPQLSPVGRRRPPPSTSLHQHLPSAATVGGVGVSDQPDVQKAEKGQSTAVAIVALCDG